MQADLVKSRKRKTNWRVKALSIVGFLTGNGEKRNSTRFTMEGQLKEKITQFIARSFQRRSLRWYVSPEVRQFWGEEQEELESDWDELFFDLIYVAMAFRLGNVLQDVVKYDTGQVQGLFLFLAQFCSMFSIWLIHTHYTARFHVDSIFHRLLFVLEAVLVAYMTLFISTPEETFSEDENGLFGFCIVKLFLHLLYLSKYIEVAFVIKKADLRTKDYQGLRNTTRQRCMQEIVTLILVSLAVFLIKINLPLVTITLLLVSFLARQLLPLLYEKYNKGAPNVPINLHFILKRMGEFKMLMLGEGVLQIIILEVSDAQAGEHLLVFGLSYLIIALIQFTLFYVLPFKPDETILRKSGWRARVIVFFNVILYCSLISVGIALKNLLKGYFEKEEVNVRRFIWLLSCSLCSCFCGIYMQKIVHIGLSTIIFKRKGQGKKNRSKSFLRQVSSTFEIESLPLNISRIIIFLIYLLSAFVFLLAPLIHTTAGVLAFSSLAILIFFLVGFVQKKLFEELEREEESDLDSEFDGIQDKKVLMRLRSGEYGKKDLAQQEAGKFVVKKKEYLKNIFLYIKMNTGQLSSRVDSIELPSFSAGDARDLRRDIRLLRESLTLAEKNLNVLLETSLEWDDGFDNTYQAITKRDSQVNFKNLNTAIKRMRSTEFGQSSTSSSEESSTPMRSLSLENIQEVESDQDEDMEMLNETADGEELDDKEESDKNKNQLNKS